MPVVIITKLQGKKIFEIQALKNIIQSKL